MQCAMQSIIDKDIHPFVSIMFYTEGCFFHNFSQKKMDTLAIVATTPVGGQKSDFILCVEIDHQGRHSAEISTFFYYWNINPMRLLWSFISHLWLKESSLVIKVYYRKIILIPKVITAVVQAWRIYLSDWSQVTTIFYSLFWQKYLKCYLCYNVKL